MVGLACSVLAVLLSPEAVGADAVYMGDCQANDAIAPEKIVARCTLFIGTALQESFGTQYIPIAHYYKALAYERLGKDSEARPELRKALVNLIGYVDGWKNYVELSRRLGIPAEPEEMLDAFLKEYPGNANVLNGVCWVRGSLDEQLNAALADCNESLRIRPGDADTLGSRCLVRFRLGDICNAIGDCDAAIESDPKQSDAFFVRGLAKLKTGDTAGGHADISAAESLDAGIEKRWAAYGLKPG